MKSIILIMWICTIILCVSSCTSKYHKKKFYCDLNNTYIEVNEGAKFDSLIINGTDTIIISKTYGYYGGIALFFISGTDTVYMDNLFISIYKIRAHSFIYKTIRRDSIFNLIVDSLPMKGDNIGIVGDGVIYYSFSAEKNGRYLKELEICK